MRHLSKTAPGGTDAEPIDRYELKRLEAAARSRQVWFSLTPDERRKIARLMSGRRALAKEIARRPVPTPEHNTASKGGTP